MNESTNIVYKKKFKHYSRVFVRTLSFDLDSFKNEIFTFYSSAGISLPDIQNLSDFFIKHLKSFINSNFKVYNHKKSSIKLLDFWIYYIPNGNESATLTFSKEPIKNFLKPDKYYAGISWPEYGDEKEAELKKSEDSFTDSFANAALYSEAEALYKENQELKRKIAWLEKNEILRPF